jgi:hypothetical protein
MPEKDPIDATIRRVSSRIVYQNPWMHSSRTAAGMSSQGCTVFVAEQFQAVSTHVSTKNRTCSNSYSPQPASKI